MSRLLAHRLPPLRSYKITCYSCITKLPIQRYAVPFRTMSRDVSHQSDIAKFKPDSDGQFRRKASTFRDTIEEGGKFAPEKGRYRLYVSYACRE